MKTVLWFFAALVVAPPLAQAMTVGTLKVKKKAFFVQKENGLFQPLDLKEKRLQFTAEDFAKCGHVLQRKLGTLSYSCKIDIPSKSRRSQLKKVLSPKKILVRFGRTEKLVRVRVSKNARYVVFQTEFDDTGVDHEVARFNDDFYGIYAKSAHLVLTKAMDQHPLLVTVVE